MATNFPTALDALNNPTPGQSQAASRSHSSQHSDLNDAIEALQAKVGINGSGVATSLDYRMAAVETLRPDLAANTGASLIGFLQSGSGAVARTMLDKAREVGLHIKDFGAAADGVTDDTDAVQAAMAEAKARGGADVDLGPGVICISDTLVIDTAGVFLRGAGGPCAATSKVAYLASAKTRLKWIGAAGGTMVKLTSNPDDDGSLGPVAGTAGLENVLLDCNELAAIGYEIRTWTYGRNRHVAVAYATQYGWLVTTLDNGVASGAADTQHMEFFNCSYNEINTANGCDAGWCVGKGASTQQGNVSLCNFFNFHSNVEGGGVAASFENCDNLYFYGYRGQSRTGVGGQTVLQAGDTGFLDQGTWDDGCRYCMFFGASGNFVAKQAAGGTADHSFGNMIFGLTRANGLSFPTIEANANLTVIETGGSGSTVPRGASIYGRRRRGHLAVIGAATALVNNVDTQIVDYDSSYDTEAAVLGTALAGITVPAGVYNCSLEAQAAFAANATGIRQVAIFKNGVQLVPSVIQKANAANTGETFVKATAVDVAVTQGDVLTLSALQNSGGALNLLATDTWLRARWL